MHLKLFNSLLMGYYIPIIKNFHTTFLKFQANSD